MSASVQEELLLIGHAAVALYASNTGHLIVAGFFTGLAILALAGSIWRAWREV